METLVGLNMHLYDDIGDASSSLLGSTSIPFTSLFGPFENRIGLCEIRFDHYENRIGLCENRIGHCEIRIGHCEIRIGLCENRIGLCENRIGLCENRIIDHCIIETISCILVCSIHLSMNQELLASVQYIN